MTRDASTRLNDVIWETLEREADRILGVNGDDGMENDVTMRT